METTKLSVKMKYGLVVIIGLFCIGIILIVILLQKPGIDKPCICPAYYGPVCGKDRVTYSNVCAMKCANQELAYDGECK
jgi:hypothetical protein